MKQSARFALCLLLADLPISTAFATPLVLEPSSDWTLHVQEDNCQLLRKFGQGQDELTVQFDTRSPAESPSLMLIGEPVSFRGEKTSLKLSMLPGGGSYSWVDNSVTRGSTLDGKPTLLVSYVPFVDKPDSTKPKYADFHARRRLVLMPARIAAIDSMLVEPALKPPLLLKLGSMAEPYASLRRCGMNVVRSWGIEPTDTAQMPETYPSPRRGADSWIAALPLPRATSQRSDRAEARVRLMVDEQGRPYDCKINVTMVKAGFVDETCQYLMHNAKFDPALNAAQKPVKGWWTTVIRFQMRNGTTASP